MELEPHPDHPGCFRIKANPRRGATTMDVRTADEILVTIKTSNRRWTGSLRESLEDFPWEVREEIAEALFAGHQSGEFDCGGQHYTWHVTD